MRIRVGAAKPFVSDTSGRYNQFILIYPQILRDELEPLARRLVQAQRSWASFAHLRCRRHAQFAWCGRIIIVDGSPRPPRVVSAMVRETFHA